MLLRQLSYAIKNQLKAPKAPYLGLWDEMLPTRGISCLSLVLYGIRIGSGDDDMLLRLLSTRGISCLSPCLYDGIRV